MATIRNRGEYQWEAQIRRKGYPAQRKTFETKADAQAWARMIESEIDRGIFVSRVEAERTAFHQLIDRYISEIAPKHKGAYSEVKRLEALKRHPLATEKRHRVHERSSAENEKSPASVNLQGFSVRLTISLNTVRRA